MPDNRIIFLGTGGARFVVARQIRSSGGMWLRLDDTDLYLDPGPGALVRCLEHEAGLDPRNLDGILLSHKHLDHSSDVNVMIEAMTEGGFKRRGSIFAPADALEGDPVVLRYVRDFVTGIHILEEGGAYRLGNLRLASPVRHDHGNVETYGVNIQGTGLTISYITDTRFFPELSRHYGGDILIISVVRLKPSRYFHLCIDEARRIIEEVRPRLAILTHFGMTVVREAPRAVAERLSQETGLTIIAAEDGMVLDLDGLSI